VEELRGLFPALGDVFEQGLAGVVRAGRGEAGRAMLREGHKLAIGGNSMIGASIANKKGRIALDVGAEAVFFENPHLPKTRSEMALPLIINDEEARQLSGIHNIRRAAADIRKRGPHTLIIKRGEHGALAAQEPPRAR